MTKAWRILVFDVLSPLTSAAAFITIGVALGWPLWWVSACAVLCLLVTQTMAANFYVLRREGVSVGTDPRAPSLRLAAVAMTAASTVAAVFVGYTQWLEPNRLRTTGVADVVRLATSVAEATGTFSPQDPGSAITRAATLVSPERAETFTKTFGQKATDLANEGVTAGSQTISAGVETINSTAASVAVIMRTVRTRPAMPTDQAVQALRVTLTKPGGKWSVLGVDAIDPSSQSDQDDEN